MIQNIIKKLLPNFWKTEGQEQLITPQDESAVFVLKHQRLKIGELSLNNGLWKFTYSEEFKHTQHKLKPLLDFPNMQKEYESKELFPFFLHRIPSISQPKVKKIIAQKNIDPENEVALLKQFGKYSIANPFVLA